jgi:hypothetical protein
MLSRISSLRACAKRRVARVRETKALLAACQQLLLAQAVGAFVGSPLLVVHAYRLASVAN